MEVGLHVSGSATSERLSRADGASADADRADSAQRREVRRASLPVFLCILGVLCGGEFPAALGELQRIKADLTPVLEADGTHAGDVVRGALSVALPEGCHVQSTNPRDP